MQIPLLTDILLIFGLSIIVILFSLRLRMPLIVGFFLTGLLAGPHGLGLIKAVHEVEIMAEIGVVLLLFTIGIEFSLKSLLKIKKSVLLGGSLQIVLTILAGYLIASFVGLSLAESIFAGFLIAVSSTAIVLKLLQEKAEIDTPHGRASLAILIFQDIIIVPLMLFTPLLVQPAGNIGASLSILLVKGIGIILFVYVCSKWIVGKILYQILRTRSRELFLLSLLVICFAVVWLTSSLGLSLALGAFLAGLIISESPYGHEALSNILPFRNVFTSFFFVSIGMLIDINFFVSHPVSIVLSALGILVLKAMIVAIVILVLGFPLRTAILTGLIISQIGEFSFILADTGVANGLLNEHTFQLFLSVTICTMAVAPLIISQAQNITHFILRIPFPKRLKTGMKPALDQTYDALTDHIVIIGYGVNGRNVARAAKAANIPYVIIEMNPDTVKNERARGEMIFYGDATSESVLEHAAIKSARIAVVAISDPAAIRRVTQIIRNLNPTIYIIVRTRYLQEMKPLYEAGADEVIPEEFETSIEIFTRVLIKYLIPSDQIEQFISEIRSDGYQMFRSLSKATPALSDLHLPDIQIATLKVEPGSPLIGKTLSQLQSRKTYKVSLIAINRHSNILPNPHGDEKIFAEDVLYILGSAHNINKVANFR